MAILGLNAKTFFAGVVATPVWTDEVGPIRDETLNLEKALADITDRRADGWRLQVGTLKDASIDANMIYDPTDPDYIQFSDAFFNDTELVLAFMDGDPNATGTYYGLIGAFSVTNFTQNRSLEEALTLDISLNPILETGTAAPPRWATVVIP